MAEEPVAGNPGNWPTADAINNRIEMSEASNGRRSPLHGLGMAFIQYGQQYGINPGIVCAVLQRESQLGCDGSILPTKCNNFGGNTWAASTGYPRCEVASGIANREWNKYPTPQEGLHGVFKNLNSDIYRRTGGRLRDVMNVYAPEYENDYNDMYLIFTTVGSNLGITITWDTNIYTNAGTVGTPLNNPIGAVTDPIGTVANWAIGGLKEALLRIILVASGAVVLYVGIKRVL